MHIRIRLRMAVLLKLFHLLVFLLVAAPGFGQRISGEATLRIDDNWNERIYAIDQLEFFEDSSQ